MVHGTALAKRLALALFAGALGAGAVLGQEVEPRILVVPLQDQIIHPVTARFLTRALHHSGERTYQCVILQLDTPGGLMDSTRHIVKEILASETPVVVYIAPQGARAGSAGVFLTLAAHVAAMAPGTNIGAAPADKNTNDAQAWARSLAEQRGRNADWAARAIRDSTSTPAQEALAEKIIDFVAADLDDLLTKLDGRKSKSWASRWSCTPTPTGLSSSGWR